MKSLKYLTCFLGAVGLVSFGCSPLEINQKQAYIIQNNSDRPIAYLVSELYPDTSVPNEIVHTLQPGKKRFYDIPGGDAELYFESLPRDTLSIFFIDSDTLSKYSFDVVKRDYLILERRELSRSDITGTISYP